MRLVKAIVLAFMLLAILGLVVGYFINSPTRGGGFGHAPAQGVYSRTGTYSTPNQLSFQIVDAKGLVEFCLKDSAGQELCNNGELHPSSFQRWVFHVDKSNRVWMYSGDLGTFVWGPNLTGSYVRATVERSSNTAMPVPRQFYQALPERARLGLTVQPEAE